MPAGSVRSRPVGGRRVDRGRGHAVSGGRPKVRRRRRRTDPGATVAGALPGTDCRRPVSGPSGIPVRARVQRPVRQVGVRAESGRPVVVR